MNIKAIHVLEEAVEDLDNGYKFYNSQNEGVGIYYWDSIFSDIESLTIYAGIHRKEFGFYRLLSRRFPYAIYYEVRDEVAYIVAILPMRKSPIWIKDIVGGRAN